MFIGKVNEESSDSGSLILLIKTVEDLGHES